MRNKRIIPAVAGIILLGLLAAAYYFFDPMEAKWMPKCLWRVATGTDCPGCGSQRMAHALMHGDFAGAWHANAYAMCMLPLILFLLWLEMAGESHPKLYARVHRQWVIAALGASVIVWWIARNIAA